MFNSNDDSLSKNFERMTAIIDRRNSDSATTDLGHANSRKGTHKPSIRRDRLVSKAGALEGYGASHGFEVIRMVRFSVTVEMTVNGVCYSGLSRKGNTYSKGSRTILRRSFATNSMRLRWSMVETATIA